MELIQNSVSFESLNNFSDKLTKLRNRYHLYCDSDSDLSILFSIAFEYIQANYDSLYLSFILTEIIRKLLYFVSFNDYIAVYPQHTD